MSKSNWIYLSSSNFPTGAIAPHTIYGANILHSSLRNPFLDDGIPGPNDYCKHHLIGGNTNAQGSVILAHLSPEYSGGVFNVNERKAVSVRALLRLSSSFPTVAANYSGIGLSVKTGFIYDLSTVLYPRPKVPLTGHTSGYSVVLAPESFSNQITTCSVWLEIFNAKMGGNTIGNSTGSYRFPVTGGILFNVWYRVRMDVIPISQSHDIIKIYLGTGSTGNETWSQIYTKNIRASWSHHFRWGHYSGSNYVGYHTRRQATLTTSSCYIDKFQVFVTSVL